MHFEEPTKVTNLLAEAIMNALNKPKDCGELVEVDGVYVPAEESV